MNSIALINGKIYVEKGIFAEAVYAENGIIEAVGSTAEIMNCVKPETELIKLGGRTVIPGINDSHVHFLMFGYGLQEVNTVGVRSIDELVDRCRAYMEEYPERCRNSLYSIGWSEDLFTEGEKRFPNRHDLDRISTEIPVVLSRCCGHVQCGNTLAIRNLGLDIGFEPPTDGVIETEEDGYPNGVFTENAAARLHHQGIPCHTPEEAIEAFRLAQDDALSKGITSIQSNDVGQSHMSMDETFRVIHEIYDSGLGKLRYRHQVGVECPEEFEHYVKTEYTLGVYKDRDRLDLGPLKLFKDGSMGGHTGFLRGEYKDDPGNSGTETHPDEYMEHLIARGNEEGVQVIIHCNGDAATEHMAASYEKVGVRNGNPLRHGMVHCHVTDRELLERLAADSIPLYVQPAFLDFYGHVVVDRVGEELASTCFAYRTQKALGIHSAYSTDCPMTDCNPFHTIYHAVTRKDKDGWPEGGLFPQECVSVEDAVDAYTAESAYNEFKEDRKGRLKKGFLADMAVLDHDIFTCTEEELYETLPDMTIIGGEIAYTKLRQ